MQSKKKSPKQVPIFIHIIAWYFFLSAVANLLIMSNLLPGELAGPISGILSNDPFTYAVIRAVPIYDMVFVALKTLFTAAILMLAGYKLLQKEKLGLWLGIFVTVFGLSFGTTVGFSRSPLEYTANIWGGIINYGPNDWIWVVMGLIFLLNLFAPFYLFAKRKIFR